MNKPNKKSAEHTLRKFRTTVNLTEKEYQDLVLLAELWDTPLPRVFRRILANNKPVVLNTRMAMEMLDHTGKELQRGNYMLTDFLQFLKSSNEPGNQVSRYEENIIQLLESNRSKIEACTTVMLDIIKKI